MTTTTMPPSPLIQNHHRHLHQNLTNTITTTIRSTKQKLKYSTPTTITFITLTTAHTATTNTFRRAVLGGCGGLQVIVVGVDIVLGMVVVAVVGYCYVINVGVVVTAFVRVNFLLM